MTTYSRRRTVKRVIETIVVALPVLLAVIALVTGTFHVDLPGILVLVGVLVLAASVYTQHWTAYLFLLGAGVGALFVPGMIALAFWIIGGLYIAIAAVNLIVIFTSPRRAAT